MELLRGVLGTTRRQNRVDNVYATWFKREVCQKLKEGLADGIPKYVTLLTHYPDYPFVRQQYKGGPNNKVSGAVLVWEKLYDAGLLEDDNAIAVCHKPVKRAEVAEPYLGFMVGTKHFDTEAEALAYAWQQAVHGCDKVEIFRYQKVLHKTITIQ
ncbi:hypothetical protein usur_42 [Escherichia phage usur]|uniref:Uncharacterized protein n=1 Tax=Escherichia phage usur TaxID=2696459 RepID=A0A6B9XBE0_9CAUD|nr:hypothetical protein usur_42 [Escherichia phage usur]